MQTLLDIELQLLEEQLIHIAGDIHDPRLLCAIKQLSNIRVDAAKVEAKYEE